MRIALFYAILFATGIASGAPAIDGWYSNVFGGYAYLPNNVNRTLNGVNFSNPKYQYGYDAGGSFGYKSNPMRYEGEVTYLNANRNNNRLNRINRLRVREYTNGVLAMANIYYDFHGIVESIKPFVGMGIGYGWVQATIKGGTVTLPTSFSASNSVFAYQATAGLTYNFAENYALTIGYRYVITTRASRLGRLFQANLANVGAVYRFDGNRYK